MNFDMEGLFETCGYLATFIGTLLEGEISLLTSVIGARLGYFNIYPAMVLAFLGAWTADWFKFIVGKTKGQVLLQKKPSLQAKIDKATIWFEKAPYLVLSFYKLFFGLTTIILLVSGIKDISYIRFAIHSAIGVALWIALLGGLGYFFGEIMITNIKLISEYKLQIVGGLFGIAFLYWILIKRPYEKKCLVCDHVE